jgi:ATP-dependent DNA helicase RecQ
MINYVESNHRCRMQTILDYFGEQSWTSCGLCDVCIAHKKKENQTESNELHGEVIRFLKVRPMTSEELEQHINPKDVELLIEVIRELVDSGAIEYDDVWNLKLVN